MIPSNIARSSHCVVLKRRRHKKRQGRSPARKEKAVKDQYLKGFRDIAISQGYKPEEVYFSGDTLIMPDDMAEKVRKAIEKMRRSGRAV